MKLHFIVMGLLVIGWVSARPMMTGSPPVEEPGKNNTVTDHNIEHITDSNNSTEHGCKGSKLGIEMVGSLVGKVDMERGLLSTNQERGAVNSKSNTQVASNDNTSETSAVYKATKTGLQESVRRNSTLNVIVKDESSAIYQDRSANIGYNGDDYGADNSENQYDGNAQFEDDDGEQQRDQSEDTEKQYDENDYSEGKPIVHNSGNKGNVDNQQGNKYAPNEINVQNGRPPRTFFAAEKLNYGNGALSEYPSSSPNKIQSQSINGAPQYISSSPQRPIGNPSLQQQSQPVFDRNFNVPYNPNGYPRDDGLQNANRPTVYILDNQKQQYAIPAQGINIVGTNLPGGTQGGGIILLNLPNNVHNGQKSEGNIGINSNPATGIAGSLNQVGLNANGGSTLPNYINLQRPLNPSSGQGLSGGQVLSPMVTSFIETTRPGRDQYQGYTDGFGNYFSTNSNIGGAIPLKETPQGPTDNKIYYYPTGSSGGGTRPGMGTNQGTSGGSQYSLQTGINGGSARPFKETNQITLEGLQYVSQAGSNSVSARPLKVANQETSVGLQYSPQAGSNGGSPRPFIEGTSVGFQNFPQASSNGGSARPLPGTNQVTLEGLQYDSQAGSNGGSVRPIKVVNQEASVGLQYSPQAGSNGGSARPFTEGTSVGFQNVPQASSNGGSARPILGTNQVTLEGLQYVSQAGTNDGSVGPFKVVNQDTSVGLQYSPQAGSNGGSARPFKVANQGISEDY